MYSDSGDDSLIGGGGSDGYYFPDDAAYTDPTGNLGHDTITENSSEGTHDYLFFYYLHEGANINLSQTSEQEVVPDLLWLTLGNENLEDIYGSEYADNIIGNSADNVIYGYGGNDTVDPQAGNDWVLAGDGDDTLIASTGDDYAYGDGGNDLYTFNPALGDLGQEVLSEPTDVDIDMLDFSAFTAATTIDLSDTGGHLQTVASGSLVVALLGSFTGTGIENVLGGSGGNTIIGNAPITSLPAAMEPTRFTAAMATIPSTAVQETTRCTAKPAMIIFRSPPARIRCMAAMAMIHSPVAAATIPSMAAQITITCWATTEPIRSPAAMGPII